jgi:hypothetical protein
MWSFPMKGIDVRETPTVIFDSAKIRIGSMSPAFPLVRGPANTSDTGKVRIGNLSPAFPALRAGGTIRFEVLERDGEALKARVGIPSSYVLDGQTFSVTLTSLERRPSTHQRLNLLRDKPTLSGTSHMLPEVRTRQ